MLAPDLELDELDDFTYTPLTAFRLVFPQTLLSNTHRLDGFDESQFKLDVSEIDDDFNLDSTTSLRYSISPLFTSMSHATGVVADVAGELNIDGMDFDGSIF